MDVSEQKYTFQDCKEHKDLQVATTMLGLGSLTCSPKESCTEMHIPLCDTTSADHNSSGSTKLASNMQFELTTHGPE